MGPIEVYKVHHHGSAYGSYDDWLNATHPKVGIISVGTGNPYGHPTTAALLRLHNHHVRTYWTEQGAGGLPDPAWDKVAGGLIRINAVWQPGGVDSIIANGIADTLTNNGTAVDDISPTVAVLSPNGGESIPTGSSTAITWTAADNVGVSTVDVDVSTDDGGTWTNVATAIPNSGSTPWNVPNTPTTLGVARVTAHDASGNTGVAISATDFSIVDLVAPTLAVTSPNGGESYFTTSTQSVTWNASDNVGVDSVNVDYSLNGAGGPWLPVQHGLPNTGTVSWDLPSTPSDSAMIQVTAFDAALNHASDVSDAMFQIQQDLTGVSPAALVFAL